MKYERYIIMLEDDGDDRHLTETFFKEQDYPVGLIFFTHSDEMLQYLSDCHDQGNPLPSLILLDKYVHIGNDGMDTLRAIKGHDVFKLIPTVIISGSDLPKDIEESYRYGANSYIVKPSRAELTANKIATFVKYWFEITELPTISRDTARQSFN